MMWGFLAGYGKAGKLIVQLFKLVSDEHIHHFYKPVTVEDKQKVVVK